MCELINLIPIKWFGDRNAYEKSDIRIITVGLNPSEVEFKNQQNETDINWRFPDCKIENPRTYRQAWNNYFKINPYKNWFYAFEKVLNGCKASYGGKMSDDNSFPNRCALHTDLCSPYATTPSWGKLPARIKKSIYEQRVKSWEKLIQELKPDLIIFSVESSYLIDLICDKGNLYTFKRKKDGTLRKKPYILKKGYYNDIPVIMGNSRNVPFGAISNEDKLQAGKRILSYYERLIRTNDN